MTTPIRSYRFIAAHIQKPIKKSILSLTIEEKYAMGIHNKDQERGYVIERHIRAELIKKGKNEEEAAELAKLVSTVHYMCSTI